MTEVAEVGEKTEGHVSPRSTQAAASAAASGTVAQAARSGRVPERVQVGLHELSVVGLVVFSRAAACTRYAKDADRAPRMASRVALMRMSAWEVGSFERVVELASTHGVEACGAAERFADVLGDLDERLRPLDWYERLVKTYLSIGLLTDFGVALSRSLPEPLRSVLVAELAKEPVDAYATTELGTAIGGEPQLAARLGLWGRRVVGEEIGTLQRLLARVPELLGGAGTDGVGDAGDRARQLHTVLSQGAVSRMKELGLRV